MKKLNNFKATALVVVLSVLFFASDGLAQLKRKLSLNYDFISLSKLDDPIPGFPASGEAEWEMFTGEVEFSFPLFAAYDTQGRHKIPKRALISKLKYQSKITQEVLFTLRDEHFNGLNYTGVYLQRIASSPWYLNLIGGVGIAADDLGEVSGSDAKFQAGLYFDRHSRDGWTWGLGFIFSQFTGDNLVIPMVHLARESDRFKFELLVPKISFDYKLNSQTTFGLVGGLEGSLYTVTDREATLFDEDGNVVKENVGVELAFSEFKIGPQLKFTPNSGVVLSLQVGVSTARRFEFLAKDEGETLRFPPETDGAGQKADFDIEPNAFFKVAVGLEF